VDHGLSRSEIECVRLAGQRLSDKEIARQLRITHKTVQNHLSKAYTKLGVNNRLDAARLLGELHPLSPIPIPEPHSAGPDVPAAGPETTVVGGDPSQRRTLYEVYAGLGRWRTPPRGPGGRLLLIIAIACGGLLIFGGAMAVLRIGFEMVEILRQL